MYKHLLKEAIILNKTFKKLLISGASLLMLAGVGTGVNNVVKPAHASAPTPNYYYSTKHKDSVYYQVNTSWDNGKKYHTYYVYGSMPKAMRSKHNLFGLYYGKGFRPLPFKVLHRRGRTYLPDYVGYTIGEHNFKFHGRDAEVMVVYVNKRDIGRLDRHQSKAFNNPKNFFKSQKQFLVPNSRTRKTHHHAKRHSRKSRLIRFRKGHKTYYAKIYKTSNN